jgi:ATP phosphoribosyltransferase regulatory subunit
VIDEAPTRAPSAPPSSVSPSAGPRRSPSAPEVARALEALRPLFGATDAALVDPPVLQPADLYIELSGEDIRSRLYFVEDPMGARSCLRPDLTIPVVRAHLAAEGARPGSYRYEGKVFRYAPPGDGRPVEFVQMGLERLAPPDISAAEDESVQLAFSAVAAVGARPTDIAFGDAGLFSAFVSGLGLDPVAAEHVRRAFRRGNVASARVAPGGDGGALGQLLSTASADAAAAALGEIYGLVGVTPVGDRPPSAVAARLAERARLARALDAAGPSLEAAAAFAAISGPPLIALAEASALARASGVDLSARLDTWIARFARWAAWGAPLAQARFSVGLSRQFAYYDGLIFEMRDAALAGESLLAAGGRYDALAVRLGAPAPCPAVGVAVRPGRLAASAGGAR